MMYFKPLFVRIACCIPLLYIGTMYASEENIAQRMEVKKFIDDMVKNHQFDSNELITLFSHVRLQDRIIKIISKPAESKPWYQYRPIFITRKRIKGGVDFWTQNQDILSRAYDTYGVPPQIITAILGVETFYGDQKGGYRMIDSLSTLAFDYPPRSKFFRSELEQYLLMTREEHIDPLSMTGSYAGAMGKAQFIASSYRQYAIDFDNDGKRDLWDNNADAIGSVAHYLSVHGWRKEGPVAAKAMVKAGINSELLDNGLRPDSTLRELKDKGVIVDEGVADDQPAVLVSLETRTGPEYWVGFENFYVITRYNHSALYAMAVYQLSEEILARHVHTKVTSGQ